MINNKSEQSISINKDSTKEELQKLNDFITKYKAVEEILPSFPITIFVQKKKIRDHEKVIHICLILVKRIKLF